MSKKKYILLSAVLTLLFVAPAYAAQTQKPSTRAEEARVAAESVGEYVQSRVQEMKQMRDAEKAAATEKVLERVRDKVRAMIENAVRRYERVEIQVENAKGLTTEEKSEMAEKISAQIEAMNTLKAEVQEAETVTELREVMSQVRSRFKLSLGLVRQAVSGVYEDRLEKVSARLGSVYENLTEKVDELDEGEEKQGLQSILAEAQVALADAEANIAEKEFVLAKQNLTTAHENLKKVAEGLK